MKKTIAAGCLALCTLGATSALAADEPANVIKYRQNVMKTIGGNISAIVSVVKGEVSYTANVAAHARGINEMSRLIAGAFLIVGGGLVIIWREHRSKRAR